MKIKKKRTARKSTWKYSNKNSKWNINKRLKRKNRILHIPAVKLFRMLKITYNNFINSKMMKKKKNIKMMFMIRLCIMMLSLS